MNASAHPTSSHCVVLCVQQSVERVQSFEEAFQKIKAATGITDIQELVRRTASLSILTLSVYQ